jgi:DivIVA domain-containing protein
MDLDKDFIERSNFSTSRRGYDPEEVEAHLRQISERVEAMRREQTSAKLAGAAAEQVRTIVEAAERSAAEIHEKAELQAKRTAQDAERAADEAKRRADAAASDQIARVEQATNRLLERADALDSEVGTILDELRQQAAEIVEALRAGAERVDAELANLRSGVHDLVAARGPAVPVAAEAAMEAEVGEAAEEVAEAGPPDAEPSVIEGVSESVEQQETLQAPAVASEEPSGVGEPEPLVEEPAAPEPAAADPTARFPRSAGGAEGARLVALNMALNGTPRAETARYLSENFELEDQESLLDDVYTQVGA